MENDIELVSDGAGLAVIGSAKDVESFVVAEGLASQDLGLQRLLSSGALAAQAGSQLAANSGRWVKLTPESARLVQKFGLRQSAGTGLATGVVNGGKGQIKSFVQFVRSPRTLLSNPEVLAGAAGIMAQLALQQAIGEITDYLVSIDAKVDDVLRAQNDTVLSRMIGDGFVIQEVMTVREATGRVDGISWSKVQGAPATIGATQAFALSRLDAIAEKLEGETNVGELAATVREAEPRVGEWLAVLARCFQLQDAVTVLELDRALETSPAELDARRLGLKVARQERLEFVAESTRQLMARINAATGTANAKVLLNPASSPAVVQSSNHIAAGVHDFHSRLGIESGHQSTEARRWSEAAVDARDKALEAGSKGLGVARNYGNEALDRASSVTGMLAGGIAEQARRWGWDDDEKPEKKSEAKG